MVQAQYYSEWSDLRLFDSFVPKRWMKAQPLYPDENVNSMNAFLQINALQMVKSI